MVKIAKTMREHSQNTIQTSIRAGKRDFHIRKRNKGTTTPWNEIPPIVIAQKIPQIEIGDYWNIFETNEDEIQEDDEEMNEIAKEAKEIQDRKKRNQSNEHTKRNKK